MIVKNLQFILDWFKNKSLLFKIFITYLFSLSIIGAIGYSYYVYVNIKSIKREVAIYKKNLTEEKKIFVSNIVNIAINGISSYYEDYKSGLIDEKTAQKNSINFINSIRYRDKIGSSTGYIWINTLDGIMIADPPKPELNGKRVWDIKDKNGVYLFREIAEVIKIKGEGFVKYCWTKLGSKSGEYFPKISYVKFFPQWKWVVGSGFYLDDIEKAILDYKERINNDILKTVINSLIFGIIATSLAGIVFFFIIFYITSHLKKLSELSIKLAEEEITPYLKLPYFSHDEIGQLIGNFNSFIDESYKLIKFKKTIEDDINLTNVYNRIFDLLHNEFNLQKFNFFQINNSNNSMKSVIEQWQSYCKQEIFLDITNCRAARTAKVINSIENDKICMEFNCPNNCNHICIPLIVGGNVGNILQIIIEEGNKFEIKKINRLSKFLKEAAPVIESKRLLEQLKESTLKDPLTNLYNRRFLDESSEMISSMAIRQNINIAILMCDVDFFKKVNDIYGHNVGDRVLKEIAKILKNSIRSSDIAVRFGGEEFLLMLHNINEENSRVIAEKIRKKVQELEISISGTIIKKTISIGYSIFPVDADSFWKCIKFSDVALYKAKETGRNKVIRFEPSMWNEDTDNY